MFNTVDLLVITSSYQLLFIFKVYFSLVSFTKQPIILRGSTVMSHPLKLAFPGLCYKTFYGRTFPYRSKLECLPQSGTSTMV